MKTRLELEQENARIEGELSSIRQQLLDKETTLRRKDAAISQHEITIHQKDTFIEELKEALILARNRKFAATSESMRGLQDEIFLFNESEQVQTISNADTDDSADQNNELITVPAHQKRRGGRRPLPEDLPRLTVIHDLSDEEKVCPHDGYALREIAEKVSEQLDVIPMQIQVIRHIRKQYACPCCDGYLKTASKPKQPIEKSQASSGLLAYIAVAKYADSLPLYRQSMILSRFGIEMDRTTLANWMVKCGQLIQPLINRMEERLLESAYLHMDESPVQVLIEPGKRPQSKSYMWVRCVGPPGNRLVLFDYDPSRSSTVPKRLLAGYQGALMVDGYEGYGAVCREQSITRLGCWVHARRKFVEANKASTKKQTQAHYAIRLIAKLYAVEKTLIDVTPDIRYATRQAQSRPVIDQLKVWLGEIRPKVAPKTALGRALHYLDQQWPRLVGYLDDGRYPIDNNPVENAIRPFAIGRKNWLFSASVEGAKASANLYSLIETAKANGLEPYGYLKQVFTRIPNIVDYDDVDRLLPYRDE